jgi:hypothetical protein
MGQASQGRFAALAGSLEAAKAEAAECQTVADECRQRAAEAESRAARLQERQVAATAAAALEQTQLAEVTADILRHVRNDARHRTAHIYCQESLVPTDHDLIQMLVPPFHRPRKFKSLCEVSLIWRGVQTSYNAHLFWRFRRSNAYAASREPKTS